MIGHGSQRAERFGKVVDDGENAMMEPCLLCGSCRPGSRGREVRVVRDATRR